jgi:molecular chaperone DnaK
VLVDITPYTFGTSVLADLDGEPYPYCYAPIIRKNTPIPVCKSEAFYTIIDNQDCVEIRVFQGENADALKNIELGKFRVEGLGAFSAGNPILIDLKLDRDGILQVAAKEKKTGLERSITIDNAVPRYNEQELDNARQRIGSLFGPEGSQSSSVLPAAMNGGAGAEDPLLDKLVARARSKLNVVGEEDRCELIDLIETLKDGRESANGPVVEQVRKQLSDLLFYLET